MGSQGEFASEWECRQRELSKTAEECKTFKGKESICPGWICISENALRVRALDSPQTQ